MLPSHPRQYQFLRAASNRLPPLNPKGLPITLSVVADLGSLSVRAQNNVNALSWRMNTAYYHRSELSVRGAINQCIRRMWPTDHNATPGRASWTL
jgi:hypothetical protein